MKHRAKRFSPQARPVVRLLRDERGFGLVETMVAITLCVLGLLAVSGLTLATATQGRVADLRNDQVTTGQRVIEQLRRDGFDAAESAVDTLVTNGRTYYVTLTVTEVNRRTKSVSALVTPSVAGLTARTFTAVLHAPRALPPEHNPFDP